MSRVHTATDDPNRKINCYFGTSQECHRHLLQPMSQLAKPQKTDVPEPQNVDIAGMSRAHPATDVPDPQNEDVAGMSRVHTSTDDPNRKMNCEIGTSQECHGNLLQPMSQLTKLQKRMSPTHKMRTLQECRGHILQRMSPAHKTGTFQGCQVDVL
jgi:hypothetical protein